MSRDNPTSFTVGRFYAYAAESVWQALVSRDFVLADWALELAMPVIEAGRTFTFKTYPILGTDFDGLIECELLHVKPQETAVFQYTSEEGARLWTSTAVWTLHPMDCGTLLLYVQSGFDPDNAGHMRIRSVLRGGLVAGLQRLAEMLDHPDGDRP
ncbi:SRPBCC family protein [Mycobacteroides franklinii]|uniref:SRPBCC domain-containing protein n=1 Tax=Mycobacteroides franklinii TaxID=948102 RepID=A0A4R5P7F9_9MYCO|nr:SRPBCC domain-containing protein [Mycobacteroides franklinii]TDH19432.1 SRPBCC domain-containing protein [Mycobacteroides franklinii]